MFQNFLRHAQASALGISRFSNRRASSYVSTHQTFPASLHRFQIHRDSKLYDRAFGQDDWGYEDGIEIAADGLVHQNITADCICANATSYSSLANVYRVKFLTGHYSCQIRTLCKRSHGGRLIITWIAWKVVRPPPNLIICAYPKVIKPRLVETRETDFSIL